MTNVFKSFAAACGLAALSVAGVSGAAQAYVNVQADPVGELVSVIQAALDALPADATEAEMTAVIQAALAGADSMIAVQALAVISADNASNPAIVSAATNAASNLGTSGFGTAGAGGQGGTTAAGAPPFGGSGGGNSDY